MFSILSILETLWTGNVKTMSKSRHEKDDREYLLRIYKKKEMARKFKSRRRKTKLQHAAIVFINININQFYVGITYYRNDPHSAGTALCGNFLYIIVIIYNLAQFLIPKCVKWEQTTSQEPKTTKKIYTNNDISQFMISKVLKWLL